MALSAGTHLGPYEIVAPLGAGGMGEVYRAHDTRLKRDVALKILPESFARDADRLARFQREAEVLAALNHPHIAQIHGVEESGGVRAIVMELVDGEELSARLARGAIPLGDALPIAKQIAEALEAAHEAGIIHRDLKPANIKVRADGTVKVLDFGLAKAIESGTGSRELGATANSPTITSPAVATAHGVILGTAAYMAPEQARGKPVDRRADIWAFGCVLFEMLTGQRAFNGETVTDVLAAVIEREPDWSALPAAVPTNIRTLLRRCLQKDPHRRARDVGDARIEVEEAMAAPLHATSREVAPARRLMWRWVALGLAASTLIALVALSTLRRDPTDVAPAAVRVTIELPEDVRLTETSLSVLGQAGHELALAPDGHRLAFAGTRGSVTQLYLRHLDSYDSRPIAGTENATVPFFSHDGAWLGFQANGQLRKARIGNERGIPEVICDLPRPILSAAWGPDDQIVMTTVGGLSRVAAGGGTPVVLTTLADGETFHVWPAVLPGNTVLFTAVPSNQLVLYDTATKNRQTLLDDARAARVLAGGHLVFYRSPALWTVPFDVETGRVTGTPVPRVEDVFLGGSGNSRSFTSSANGLLYVTGGANRRLVGVDRDGRVSPLFDETGTFEHPSVSPDGTRIAFDVGLASAKDRGFMTWSAARELA